MTDLTHNDWILIRWCIAYRMEELNRRLADEDPPIKTIERWADEHEMLTELLSRSYL